MRSMLLWAALAAMGWVLSSCELPGEDEPTITGTITYRGAQLPDLAAWVLAGEINTPDSLIVEPAEADGSYLFRGVEGGEYEVFGVVDVDHSGSPGGAWHDVMGYHPDMPVTVPAEGLEGVDVNVGSAYAWTASCFDGDGAYMVGIGARVLDGEGNDLAGEASVSVTGGASGRLSQTRPHDLNCRPPSRNRMTG